ncbi:hypothetical protein Tco_1427075 [Tanacetum coccineum]
MRGLRDIAELYGSELSLEGVQEYRKSAGIETISIMSFKAAGISALLIDDGLKLDKMLATAKHGDFVPFVGRILRIESLAEEILDQGIKNGKMGTTDDVKVVGLKSIAAYRGGLDINPNVTTKEAEEGLAEVLLGEFNHVTLLYYHWQRSQFRPIDL